MNIFQLLIFVLSGLAVMLTTGKTVNRWGFVAGVAAQPIWIWATWGAEQWGMFALSLWFLICYARGVWLHFVKAGEQWTPEQQLYHLHLAVQEDNRWMAHNKIVSELTDRYLRMLEVNWYQNAPEDVSRFRSRIGLDPNVRPLTKDDTQ